MKNEGGARETQRSLKAEVQGFFLVLKIKWIHLMWSSGGELSKLGRLAVCHISIIFRFISSQWKAERELIGCEAKTHCPR